MIVKADIPHLSHDFHGVIKSIIHPDKSISPEIIKNLLVILFAQIVEFDFAVRNATDTRRPREIEIGKWRAKTIELLQGLSSVILLCVAQIADIEVGLEILRLNLAT